MNIELVPKIHNRFDFTVTNIETGEVKKMYAENVVLTQTYNDIIQQNSGRYTYVMGIGVGDGITVPVPSNSGLENPLLFKNCAFTKDKSQIKPGGSGICTMTGTIRIEANELIGKMLSEVGVGEYISKMWTRALLQDANGNPIVIEKTGVTIVDIYSTSYLEYPKEISGYKLLNGGLFDWGSSLGWSDGRGALIFFSGANSLTFTRRRVGKSWFDETPPSEFNYCGLPGDAGLSASVAIDVPNKRRTYIIASVTAAQLNIGGIRSVIIGSIEVPVPNEYISQPVIVKEVVGSGDGINKTFSTKFGWIKNNGTLKVYVNDIEQQSGVSVIYNSPAGNAGPFMAKQPDVGSRQVVKNIMEKPIKKIIARGTRFFTISASDSFDTGYTSVWYATGYDVEYILPENFKNKKFWRIGDSHAAVQSNVEFVFDDDIVFETPPPEGSTITVTYQPDCIAKDETKIINNISYTLGL